MRHNLFMNHHPAISILATSVILLTGSVASAQVKTSPVIESLVKIAPTSAIKTTPVSKNSKAQLVNSIVVVVNDEVITRKELDVRLESVERRLTSQGTALPNREELQKQLLERMIVDRAQMQLARENGMRVDDTMLDRAVQRMAEQNKMTVQIFRNTIEKEGTSFAVFREEIRDDIMMQRIREREVDSKIQVTELEIDNFLAADEKSPNNQQEINLAQILIRIPEKATPEQIAKQQVRAEEALRKIRAGEDFAKIAAAYSDAPEALKGGEIGWREQDRLPQLFLDAVNKVKVGEVAEGVRSSNGFHIVKLLGKRTAAPKVEAPNSVQQTHVRHILIKISQVVTAADAKQKLFDLKQKIEKKTATFEDSAKSFSNDLSATKGGDLGWIYPGDTAPEFEQAMNKLAINELSDPVESPFGVHLIQVTERKSDDVSQERKRNAARQAVRERKSDAALQDWLRELRDKAYVEFRLDKK
jgi:peptidyl-prolyl cis-trans isomerase SurA